MTYDKWKRDCEAVALRDGLTSGQFQRMLRIHKDHPEPSPSSDLVKISMALKSLGLLATNDRGKVVIQKVINTPANLGKTVAHLLASLLETKT